MRETAYAKINLALHVRAREADGYHRIETLFALCEDGDVVTAEPADRLGLTVTGPFAAALAGEEDNLVLRAARAAGATATITLDKRLPVEAGLGGGSADAAAVLRWAGHTDLVSAARLGADVAFCLVGGRARVTGIGEIVEPLPPQRRPYTLVIPPLSCSTPAVYRAWDDLGGPTGDGPNDLLPAALVVEPTLARWRDRIREACGTDPVLAGSGATWFLAGHHPDLVTALPDAHVVLTSSEG
jgi:4-diphosphocytidyl-2-C-methyl-D-erythritol kinase